MSHPRRSAAIHPLWMRISHWLNALAVLILVSSGWRIYNASPLFAFSFPPDITLGGWLGGALQWHFAAMWLLVGTGVFYLAMNLITGRFWRKFFPISFSSLIAEASAALHGVLAHADPRSYNNVQRLAYLFVMLDLMIIVISGLVLWKSVQFHLLRDLIGGYEFARYVHFFAMAALVSFIVLHLVMVALVPRTLLTMLIGRGKETYT